MNISTHYLAEKIKDHFKNGLNFGVEINYVTENKPLGTVGALSLMEPPSQTTLVINGDILTRVDFRGMLSYHQKHNADLTIGVRQFDMEIPYGVVECDGPLVRHLQEKPKFNFLVNAGIYLLEPTAHSFIPADQHYDMTDLIVRLIEEKLIVVSYPIVEYWLDIGEPLDYKQAEDDLVL